MSDEFTIRQWDKYKGGDWWKWAVWVDGESKALDDIEFVEWTLHPTFTNPVRKTSDRASNFRLETGGWGTFPIIARLQLKNGGRFKLRHSLKLYYPDGKATDK